MLEAEGTAVEELVGVEVMETEVVAFVPGTLEMPDTLPVPVLALAVAVAFAFTLALGL